MHFDVCGAVGALPSIRRESIGRLVSVCFLRWTRDKMAYCSAAGCRNHPEGLLQGLTTQKTNGESLKQGIFAIATAAGELKKVAEVFWERQSRQPGQPSPRGLSKACGAPTALGEK
jgi:hypothetical protein